MLVPDVSGAQVAPASVLFRIVPVSPTTKPVPESRRIAPFWLLVVPESTGDHCPKTDEIREKMRIIARIFVLGLDIYGLCVVGGLIEFILVAARYAANKKMSDFEMHDPDPCPMLSMLQATGIDWRTPVDSVRAACGWPTSWRSDALVASGILADGTLAGTQCHAID